MLTPTESLLVLSGVFVAGLAAGFLWAGWVFAVRLRTSGYQLSEHNYIIPLEKESDDDTPQE